MSVVVNSVWMDMMFGLNGHACCARIILSLVGTQYFDTTYRHRCSNSIRYCWWQDTDDHMWWRRDTPPWWRSSQRNLLQQPWFIGTRHSLARKHSIQNGFRSNCSRMAHLTNCGFYETPIYILPTLLYGVSSSICCRISIQRDMANCTLSVLFQILWPQPTVPCVAHYFPYTGDYSFLLPIHGGFSSS